jgi:hypothetical protein
MAKLVPKAQLMDFVDKKIIKEIIYLAQIVIQVKQV